MVLVKNDLYIVKTLTKMRKENAENHLVPCFSTYQHMRFIISFISRKIDEARKYSLVSSFNIKL